MEYIFTTEETRTAALLENTFRLGSAAPLKETFENRLKLGGVITTCKNILNNSRWKFGMPAENDVLDINTARFIENLSPESERFPSSLSQR
ncbi:MAG: hypothetical protein IJT77_01690 [Clostridia bacterium]|nr:hypothetical protein [Clostridia bacterium]